MKNFDVVAICNALMDLLIQAQDNDLLALGLVKGNMHLVEAQRQEEILSFLSKHVKTEELGGSALNSIRTLARLGSKTVFAGMVGQDAFGDKIQSRLRELGIAAKIKDSEMPTGTCAILVTPDGERTMNTHLGASRLFDESLVPYEEIAGSKIFHFCGYQWDTDGQKAAIHAAINYAKSHQTMVSFDAADPFVVERNTGAFRQMIHDDADIVFANEQEARLLYGTTPAGAADAIAASGAIAVIKLGAKGALIAKGTERIHVEAIPTKVVDTTSAGDMFAAGFLYGMHKEKPLAECGKMAALIASDVISRYGAAVSDDVIKTVQSM